MSNKGKVFSRADLPRITQQRIKNKQVGEAELKRLDDHLAAQTERNKVVALDGNIELIAEELDERAVRYHATVETDTGYELDSPVLVQLRNMLSLDEEQRTMVLMAFGPNGDLIHPFTEPAEAPKAKKKPK